MNQQEIIEKLKSKLNVGLDINTKKSSLRSIINIPPYKCSNTFKNEEGYKVKIAENTNIDIPLSMIINIYKYSFNKNRRIYETYVFRELYPKQSSNHGCYVHSIGQIFVKAGIAKDLENGTYEVY
jgi:hypothetical protein